MQNILKCTRAVVSGGIKFVPFIRRRCWRCTRKSNEILNSHFAFYCIFYKNECRKISGAAAQFAFRIIFFCLTRVRKKITSGIHCTFQANVSWNCIVSFASESLLGRCWRNFFFCQRTIAGFLIDCSPTNWYFINFNSSETKYLIFYEEVSANELWSTDDTSQCRAYHWLIKANKLFIRHVRFDHHQRR